jgi:hypothetical protein
MWYGQNTIAHLVMFKKGFKGFLSLNAVGGEWRVSVLSVSISGCKKTYVLRWQYFPVGNAPPFKPRLCKWNGEKWLPNGLFTSWTPLKKVFPMISDPIRRSVEHRLSRPSHESLTLRTPWSPRYD